MYPFISSCDLIKTWTPISCVLAMQHLAQKDGSPEFLLVYEILFSICVLRNLDTLSISGNSVALEIDRDSSSSRILFL